MYLGECSYLYQCFCCARQPVSVCVGARVNISPSESSWTVNTLQPLSGGVVAHSGGMWHSLVACGTLWWCVACSGGVWHPLVVCGTLVTVCGCWVHCFWNQLLCGGNCDPRVLWLVWYDLFLGNHFLLSSHCCCLEDTLLLW